MEKRNEYFLDLITQTKESIEKIQITTKEKEYIEGSIEKIRDEVTKINKYLKKLNETIEEETVKLNSYRSEINSIQFELLEKDTDKIKSIIQANLPNIITSKEVKNKIELYRTISLDKNDTQYIGYIKVKEHECNKNIVKLKIKDEHMNIDIEEKFEVTNPLRIYNIIVYLNLKLNYENT